MAWGCWEGRARTVTWPLLYPLVALGTDIDECEDHGDPVCGAWRCENNPGSYRCVQGCQPGFHLAPSGDCIGESEGERGSEAGGLKH